MYTPVNPSCTIIKWAVRGSPLHGHVFVMNSTRAYCGRHEKWQRFTAIRDRRIVENRRHRFILCLLVTSSKYFKSKINHLMDSRAVRVVEFSVFFINWGGGSNPDRAHFFISCFFF